METVFANTIKSISDDLAAGKRTVKAIAAECAMFETQIEGDYMKACFARLADCRTRKDFAAVIASIDADAQVARIEADLTTGCPVDEETGMDTREWSGESIEAAYAEALMINAALDEEYPLARKILLWSYLSEEDKERTLAVNHAEALEMNITEKQVASYLAQQEFSYMSANDKAMAISRDHAEALAINAAWRPHLYSYAEIVELAKTEPNKALRLHWEGCSNAAKTTPWHIADADDFTPEQFDEFAYCTSEFAYQYEQNAALYEGTATFNI